jgi:hypothetical protein
LLTEGYINRREAIWPIATWIPFICHCEPHPCTGSSLPVKRQSGISGNNSSVLV